jgi:hypothetical protein
MAEEYQVKKFDRIRGGLQNVGFHTKPSTIQNIQNITGESETFIVETIRQEEIGDTIFIQMVDRDGTTRLALPPKVANAIAAQRDSITTRRRSITGRRVARERMDRGEKPGFMRRTK